MPSLCAAALRMGTLFGVLFQTALRYDVSVLVKAFVQCGASGFQLVAVRGWLGRLVVDGSLQRYYRQDRQGSACY